MELDDKQIDSALEIIEERNTLRARIAELVATLRKEQARRQRQADRSRTEAIYSHRSGMAEAYESAAALLEKIMNGKGS